MPGITGMGTTYNLPNFVGELFGFAKEDTPLLSAIGGLTGGESTKSTLFTWQSADLRDADATRQRIEGADAPNPEERVRVGGRNCTEIHQESVAISYSKQGATMQVATDGQKAVQLGQQPVQDELAWQLRATLKQMARDTEKSFIVGQYQFPADNSQPRKTGGLLEAIKTNVVTNAAPAAITSTMVLDLMQKVWESGGIQEGETRTLIVNATLKRSLTKLFITDAKYQEQTRNVGGVHLQVIETDFGKCNIMLDRWMPADTLVVCSLEQLSPAFLEVPGKGHFFAEPLARTGSADKYQVYGELGLKWGNEITHGKITNLTAAAGA